jgi:putative SOS response-associated peptidase YedK
VCGRYTLSTVDGPEIAQRFSLITPPEPETLGRFNVCPTETIATVLQPNETASVAWGLRPFRNGKFAPINVRSETAAQRFKWLMTGGRCLVIADGWYEWLKAERPKQPRQPIHFRLPGREPLAFAGLWTTWRPRDGRDPLRTCTIVTTAANRDSMRVHDRMPVVLSDEAARVAWLDPALDGEAVTPLLAPLPDGLLELVPANPVVNKAGYEGADCLEAPAALF